MPHSNLATSDDKTQFLLVNKTLYEILNVMLYTLQPSSSSNTISNINDIPSTNGFVEWISEILNYSEDTIKSDLPDSSLFCMEIDDPKLNNLDQYHLVMKTDLLQMLNSINIAPAFHKKIKIEHFEEPNDLSTWLPAELWIKILGYVHHEHNQTHHNFFKPAFARVNSYFNRYANDLVKLPSERNYQLMVYCLVGKITAKRLIRELQISHENPYQKLFSHICLKVARIAEQTSFKTLEEISSVEEVIDDYNESKGEFSCQITPNHQQLCKREDLLNLFFELNDNTRKQLMTLTPHKSCHYALMALACIQKNKALVNLEKLASLYAETGFLRGTLFILEFCQGFQVWKDASMPNSSKPDKNNFLLNVLKSSVVWPPVGEYIGRYMTKHYHFHYDLIFILKSIRYCQTFNQALNLLFIDVRHYSSPNEMLKIIAATSNQIEEYYDFHPIPHGFDEKLTAIQTFVNEFIPEFDFNKDENSEIAELDNGEGYEENMVEALYILTTAIKQSLEGHLAPQPFNLVTEILEEEQTHLEPVGDLKEFFDAAPSIPDNQKEFYSEAAELCQQTLDNSSKIEL